MSHQVQSYGEFYNELATHALVCVDFFATWCPPCKTLGPVLDKLAVGIPAVHVIKVDVDMIPELKEEHRVSILPTILFFAHGLEKPELAVSGANVTAIRHSYKMLLSEQNGTY
jgi:thioredoxin 1